MRDTRVLEAKHQCYSVISTTMAGTTVNQNGNNAAALRRDAHTSGVCGFGQGGGEVLCYSVWLRPSSQCISATATLARDFFDFYNQQTPTMKKISKL